MAKTNKADMSCARVKKYTASDVSKAERHNERKNETYENMNVIEERIPYNVHFKKPTHCFVYQLVAIWRTVCEMLEHLYGTVKADGNRRAGVASWVKERRNTL